MNRNRSIGIVIAAVAFSIPPLLGVRGYFLRVLTLILVFTLFTIALNIVFGLTDQLFLSVGGLAGLGAYSTIIFASSLGVSPWIGLPVGMALAGLVGVIISYIAARLQFSLIVIAIFTLALQLSLIQFFVGARSITGGSTGLPVQNTGLSGLSFYFIFLLLLAAFMMIYQFIVNSRFGIAFDALRADDLAARSIGVNVAKYKTYAGGLSALLIGLVGALFGFSEGYLTPSTFMFQSIDFFVLIMLVLGGIRTTWGPLVGSVVIILLTQSLATAQGWQTAILGLLLIVSFLYFRAGIVPKAEEYEARLRRYILSS